MAVIETKRSPRGEWSWRAYKATLGNKQVIGLSEMRQEGECMPCLQPWMSDTEESPFLDPALRKRAVKVKHVKRREKKSEKKVMERVKWLWEGRG